MHDHNDFTYDSDKYAGLDKFVDQLHGAGMHYVIIIGKMHQQTYNIYL